MRLSADMPLPPDELATLRSRPQPGGVAALRMHLRDRLHWYLAVLLFVALLVAWHLITAFGIVHEIIVPSPLAGEGRHGGQRPHPHPCPWGVCASLCSEP